MRTTQVIAAMATDGTRRRRHEAHGGRADRTASRGSGRIRVRALLFWTLALCGLAPAAARADTPSRIYVDRAWTQAAAGAQVGAGRFAGLNAFGTIQTAVNAARSGSIVEIAPGTYVEQVVITGKDLTLAGSGAGVTTIVSPDTLPVTFTAGGFTNHAVVLCQSTPRVEITDLTVNGNGRGNLNERFVGIGYFNAGGKVASVNIVGVRNTPLDNVQHGFALYCTNTLADNYTLECDHVSISDFQKNGMLLNGPGMVVNVHDSNVTGSGDLDLIAQNGIQIGSGAGGTIRDCAVTDLRYVPAIAVSAAILVFQPGSPVYLSGFTGANAFVNVQSPIRWYDGNGTIDGAERIGPVIEAQDFAGVTISNFTATSGALAATPDVLPPASPVVDAAPDHGPGVFSAQSATAFSVDVSHLCMAGGDTPGTTGLYVYSSGAPMNVNATGLLLHDWDFGVRATGAAVTVHLDDSSIASSLTAGVDNSASGNAFSATSVWWGDPSGPSGDGPGTGDPVVGPNVDWSPWLYDGTNAATGCGFHAAPERVTASSAASCISPSTPCVTFDVTIDRTTMTGMRAFSIPIQLSSNLQLCAGTTSIHEGDYLSAAGVTYMTVLDNGGGSYTVDGTILGLPCGAIAQSGTLFRLDVSKAPGGADGLGSVTVGTPVLRDCDNASYETAAGPAALITIESTGLPDCGLSGLPEHIAVSTADSCISSAAPCATFDVTISRTTATNVRAFSIPVQLSSNLQLCADTSSFTEGDYLSSVGATYFTVLDNGGGSYTVDATILGVPCGATAISGTLFHLQVAKAGPDGTGTVTLGAPILRDCDNNPIAADSGAAATITIDTTGPAAIADVAAAQITSGNDTDGTTKVRVTFSTPGDAVSAEVYRAGFGNYPEYDDPPGAGAVPAPPAYPPGPPWTLTPVTASGQDDEVAQRDFWYYVVFTKDVWGNVSATSNRTGGTLNYHLGDVSDGATPGQGDNRVLGEDISLLGSHYPMLLGTSDTLAFLDVGPTADRSVHSLPATDNAVNFEDLIVFALNYSVASAPVAAAPTALPDRDALSLDVPELPAPGRTFEVPLLFSGRGDVHGVSVGLEWNPDVVVPVGIAGGALLAGQPRATLALPSGPGAIDIAILGAGDGIAGTGTLASAKFRVVAPGEPDLRIGRVDARDASNRSVPVEDGGVSAEPVRPARTALTAVVPNPLPGAGRIEFTLARAGRAGIAVFDLAGRRVRTLLDASLDPGAYHVAWDGRGDGGSRIPAGFYVVRLEAGGVVANRRVMIVR